MPRPATAWVKRQSTHARYVFPSLGHKVELLCCATDQANQSFASAAARVTAVRDGLRKRVYRTIRCIWCEGGSAFKSLRSRAPRMIVERSVKVLSWIGQYLV
jgi:hypothetical protein